MHLKIVLVVRFLRQQRAILKGNQCAFLGKKKQRQNVSAKKIKKISKYLYIYSILLKNYLY